MAKTRAEIISQTLRDLGVLASDENPTADDEAFVGGVYDAVVPELSYSHGVVISDSDAVDDKLFVPLGQVVAADCAGHFTVAPPVPRHRALGRLKAAYTSDDRADPRDIDEDGSVSDAEADAAARAEFY